MKFARFTRETNPDFIGMKLVSLRGTKFVPRGNEIVNNYDAIGIKFRERSEQISSFRERSDRIFSYYFVFCSSVLCLSASFTMPCSALSL